MISRVFRNQPFVTLLGILASIVFLWLAYKQTDIAQISLALSTADPVWIVPLLAALGAFYWLKSHRWADLLSPAKRLSAKDLFPVVMIGYAGTAVLPMQMGELVRAYVAGREFDLPYSLLLGSIVVEKLLDFLIVLLLLGVVLATGEQLPAALVTAGYVILIGCLAALLFCGWFIYRTNDALRIAKSFTGRLPPAIQEVILAQLRSAAARIEVLRRAGTMLRVIATSILQWLLMGLCIGFSLIAVGIDVPVAGVFVVLIATVIGISLPTSPGYVGNIQLAFTIGLRPYDVDAATAFAASVYYHAVAYVSCVVVGLFFLNRFGYRLGQIRTHQLEEPTH